MEEVGGGDGVSAGVGEITRAQFCCSEVDECEDAATAGGRWELVECGGECGSCCIVVAGLEVNVAGERRCGR